MTKNQFIGRGSYGCVFDNSFNCKKKQQSKNKESYDVVSKIFKENSDAVDELEKNKLLKSINVRNKFTPKFIQHCYVNDTFDDTHKKICGFDINKHDYKQIIFEKGGVDLYHLLFHNTALNNHVHLLTLLKSMYNLFYGINKITMHNLIHDDVRLENILFNVKTDRMYLIDWGFLSNANEIFSKDNLQMLLKTYKYYYFPPEMKIIGYMMNNCLIYPKDCNYNLLLRINIQSDVFISKFIRIMKRSLNEKLKNQDPKNIQNFKYFFSGRYKENRKNDKREFISKLYKTTQNITNTTVDVKKRNKLFHEKLKQLEIWKKIDIFMIGLVLLIVTTVYFQDFPDELVEFDKNIQVYDKLIELIMSLLNSNPEKRIAPKDAEKSMKKLFIAK